MTGAGVLVVSLIAEGSLLCSRAHALSILLLTKSADTLCDSGPLTEYVLTQIRKRLSGSGILVVSLIAESSLLCSRTHALGILLLTKVADTLRNGRPLTEYVLSKIRKRLTCPSVLIVCLVAESSLLCRSTHTLGILLLTKSADALGNCRSLTEDILTKIRQRLTGSGVLVV